MVAIEAPGLEDVDTLVELWTGLVRTQQPHGTRLRPDANASHARDWLLTRMTFDGVRLARREGMVVGFVSFELMRDQFVRAGQDGIIHTLFVRDGYRRTGIGTALIETAEARLRERGADRVRLEILVDNEGAGSFYRERGYSPIRTTYAKGLPEK